MPLVFGESPAFETQSSPGIITTENRMARLVFVAALLVLCALVAVSESAAFEKSSFAEKLSALRAKLGEKKTKEVEESETIKSRRNILALKRKAFEAKKSSTKVTAKNDLETVDAAGSVTTGNGVLSGVLQNGEKRGLKLTAKSSKMGTKKSYQEVFFVGDFLLAISAGYELAPCSVGMNAIEGMMQGGDPTVTAPPNSIQLDDIQDDEAQYFLAFIEWWTENKCSEFFASEYSFYNYVWSIFWDDLEETPCYHELPQDADGTVDWRNSFNKVNSNDPAVWESSFPQPRTECEQFEMVGEIYFDFFFAHFFDALPDKVLEEIYDDFKVNDALHPYFGYGY